MTLSILSMPWFFFSNATTVLSINLSMFFQGAKLGQYENKVWLFLCHFRASTNKCLLHIYNAICSLACTECFMDNWHNYTLAGFMGPFLVPSILTNPSLPMSQAAFPHSSPAYVACVSANLTSCLSPHSVRLWRMKKMPRKIRHPP